jgi:hypothetical protein
MRLGTTFMHAPSLLGPMREVVDHCRREGMVGAMENVTWLA